MAKPSYAKKKAKGLTENLAAMPHHHKKTGSARRKVLYPKTKG